MAEAVGLASGITTLVSTVYSSCQKLTDTLNGINNAPRQIRKIGKDLEDVYSGLGILQSLLNDQECDSGISEPAISENVSQALNTCLKVFKELSLMVSEYRAPHEKTGVRAWQRAKWTLKRRRLATLGWTWQLARLL